MNLQEYRNLQEAYLNVYQELDEVRGGGKIDAVSDIPSIGERGSRSAKDAGMLMSPLDRATARVNALKKRGTPEATKRANRINSRFVNPTNSAVNRSVLAAINARSAEKRRLMNPQESYNPDLFDYIMEYLMIEGYANTNENALVIMANMSEDWKQSIVEVTGRGRIDPIGNTQNYGYGPGYMPNTSSGIGERNSRTPEDAGLRMSPLDRAKAKANSLKKRDDPESTKRANRINSRFVNPTERAFQRSMLAAANVGVALRRKSKQDKAKG